MTSDQLNRTGSIKYDYRNLMTEIRAIKTEANPDPFGTPTIDVLYLTQYRYDEDWQSQFSETAKAVSTTCNRIRKVRYKYTGSTPDPEFDLSGDAPPWTLQSDEFYVRDVSGKEIAIYSGSSLTQWNIWGLDNPPGGGQVVGKIPACRNGSSGRNADTTRNYYLKDHLGSIRVVLNSTNSVISAQDYDACLTYSASAEEVGYPLENRTYNASAMKYDFTGKERDNETSYDYFGARYYDSRIGRWGQVEPLLDKYVNLTPYCYSINNPVIVKDPNGKDPRVTVDGNSITLTTDVYYTTDENYKYAFNSDTEYLLENLKDGADLWNEAGESITIDNENYNVRFEVNLHKVSIYEMTSIAPGVIPPPGVNIAKYNEDAIKEMVLNGNIIELVDPKVLTSKGYELPQYWDTHELGHILGFKDMFKDSKLQEGSFNIMGGNLKHGKPTKEDVEKLIKGLGIDLKNKAHSEVKKGGTVQP